jgi:DNA-binding MarR family transcriptional regulator
MKKMDLGDAVDLVFRLRQMSGDMPIAQAYCLLLIGRYEGLSVKDIAERADIGMASASRYVSMFSNWHRPGEEGLGLVEAVEDPMERRKKIVRLTPKGKQTMSKILGGR